MRSCRFESIEEAMCATNIRITNVDIRLASSGSSLVAIS